MSLSAVRRECSVRTRRLRAAGAPLAIRARRAARRRADWREERGSVLVIAALALTAIVLFAAFTIDVGTGFQDERHLQLQADASALAGADEFLQHPTICPGNIPTEAATYAQLNESGPTKAEEEKKVNEKKV